MRRARETSRAQGLNYRFVHKTVEECNVFFGVLWGSVDEPAGLGKVPEGLG